MSLDTGREIVSRFLEFLKSRIEIDCCSCVVVFCLSPTEEPRQEQSRGGETFTHQQNSQHHFRESLMVVLKTETLFTAPWRTNSKKKHMVVNKHVMSFLVLIAKSKRERVANKGRRTIIFPGSSNDYSSARSQMN